MPDTTYNGWTNWETWLVHLWFGDSLQCYVEEDRIEDPDDLKNYVHDFITEVYDQKMVGFVGDALNGTLSEVNWREILAHYKE